MIISLQKDWSNLNEALQKIVKLLKEDKVGAIPTETFYGLAANPFSEKALTRLFFLKKRPPDKPILLLIGTKEELFKLVQEVPPLAERLIENFWPGPLTIVFEAKNILSPFLTAKTGTIGVRLSSSPLIQKLCVAFGNPVTGTSANLSNFPPCKTAEEVKLQIPEIDFILDAGKLEANLPSTVISVVKNQLKLIREGIIPFEKILKVLNFNNKS
ncbi:MAG: L-threonylcarbamoyladenylate synthase [Thermodesulfobacteriaceae bacterium]|nr:L-threonylcarbamoyladenylate synthase [Thermodesulfobacteriaceae bacterium]MCX8041934.1 L-threonylcarbamoyladenylate synthase [Thermodesulfobacteriaceae bacterium]